MDGAFGVQEMKSFHPVAGRKAIILSTVAQDAATMETIAQATAVASPMHEKSSRPQVSTLRSVTLAMSEEMLQDKTT